ncbi:putative GPI-anchored protein pfl2 [Marmota marmota marmota]|uniref:putative GPI-anchored protein pfl2 n=1 Tax=Marmota marmota marmota TaxID=9994 RepID=UPI0020926C34|nr:putative GPI-anchored protein pfl2 [Marmota marmota marmota]
MEEMVDWLLFACFFTVLRVASALPETILCPSTTLALSHSGRDHITAPEPNSSPTTGRTSVSETQERMTATLPSSPLTSSLAGPMEQTNSTPGTWEERQHTTITTSTNDTILSSSMMTSLLKDQTSRNTTLPTTLPITATLAENPKQDQTTPMTAPLTTNTLDNGLESLVSPDSEKAATTPVALKTPGNDTESSRSTTITVSETSALTTSSTTLDKVNDTSELLSMTTSTVIYTTSLNTSTLGTIVLGTTMTKTREEQSTAAPPTPATTPSTSKPPDTYHNTTMWTPSQPAQSASSVGTETTAAYSTALVFSSLGTVKSSAVTGPSQTPPRYSQHSSPRAGACALDEYTASTGVCLCNDSYHTHSELSRMPVTLYCWPQKIGVALSSCFLETNHWILKEDVFSGCSSTKKIEQGYRVQVFMMEKKEGSCGLHLSTNNSHALYSLKVQLKQVVSGSKTTESTMLFSFSCAYPLVVNISQTLPEVVDSIPTIHFPSTGETIIFLSIFTDIQLSAPLKNRTAHLGTPLYIVLNATSSDPNRFALVVNEVFVSANISNKKVIKATYHFVSERASMGNIVRPHLKKKKKVLCRPQTCRPRNPSARNSPREIQSQEDLERGGSWIVFGPLRITESEASSSRSSPGSWMAIFLLMVIDWMLG